MRSSRTTNLILAGTFGFGSLIALAAPAMAETPAQDGEEMVLVFAPSDPEPAGPIFAPAPAPEPEVADDKAPPPQPEPQPDPTPDDDLEITQPTGHGDPEPEGELPKGTPEVDPDPEDGFDGPGDITSDPGCTLTHGCPDEEPTPDGHCFDEAGEVVDPSECIPTDDGDEPTDGDEPADSSTGADTEVLGSSTDRGALPRTGGGLAVLALAGSALAGFGAALRKVAKR